MLHQRRLHGAPPIRFEIGFSFKFSRLYAARALSTAHVSVGQHNLSEYKFPRLVRLVGGTRMLSTMRTAAAAACVLSVATGFFVPALGPRCAIPATFHKFRRISATAAAVSSPGVAVQGRPLRMAATPVVKRVAIVGAGVGGLTLANALSKGDMAVEEVKVFEKFDSVKPGIGGGVQINSGAVTLARLGLGDAVKVCHAPSFHRFGPMLLFGVIKSFSAVRDASLGNWQRK